jgi:hypothetical protein
MVYETLGIHQSGWLYPVREVFRSVPNFRCFQLLVRIRNPLKRPIQRHEDFLHILGGVVVQQ